MLMRALAVLFILLFAGTKASGEQSVLTIAVPDDDRSTDLRKFSEQFQEQNRDIKLEWVQLPENQLREKVKSDLVAGRGADVVYVSSYDATLLAEKGLLKPLENIPPDYDLDDVFQTLLDAFSYNGQLYALPLQGESSMLFYRKDLFAERGLEMPEHPTYDDIIALAKAFKGGPRLDWKHVLHRYPGKHLWG